MSLTEKDARPSAPVITEPGEITALPDVALNVTALPATGLVLSSNVTVTVPVGCRPFWATLDTIGVEVVTVESFAETVSTPNVMLTLCPVRGLLPVP
jgi:hypothetical protein